MVTLSLIRIAGVAALALVATTLTLPHPATADEASTAAIVAGASAIVGGLLYDANNRPYYERGGHRVYVNRDVEQEYRGHGGRYRDNHGQWHGNQYRHNHGH
jgi:hypothetical protein